MVIADGVWDIAPGGVCIAHDFVWVPQGAIGQGGAIANKKNPIGKNIKMLSWEMLVFISPVTFNSASSMVSCEGTACGVIEKKRAL